MNSGAYQLIIYIPEKIEISIGSLGDCHFPKGWYVYTGSAMKNFSQRIARHSRTNKKIRWHIDYLLSNPAVLLKGILMFRSTDRQECSLNLHLLELPGTKYPIKGFGSSDCSCCPSHLLKVTSITALRLLKDSLVQPG